MKRDYPERPFVGVGAVIWRGDKILLVRRGRPPRQGEWSLPGGAQHVGETLHQAVLREIHEETGLTIKIAGLVDVVDAIFKDKDGQINHHYSLVDFAAHWISGEAIAADDASDVRWVSLDEVDRFIDWDETARVIFKSKEIVAMHQTKPTS